MRFAHCAHPGLGRNGSSGSGHERLCRLVNRHARSISDALNEHARDVAIQDAAATGTIQTPKQVLIGQNLHRCAACSPGGSAITVIPLPTAAAILPPQR